MNIRKIGCVIMASILLLTSQAAFASESEVGEPTTFTAGEVESVIIGNTNVTSTQESNSDSAAAFNTKAKKNLDSQIKSLIARNKSTTYKYNTNSSYVLGSIFELPAKKLENVVLTAKDHFEKGKNGEGSKTNLKWLLPVHKGSVAKPPKLEMTELLVLADDLLVNIYNNLSGFDSLAPDYEVLKEHMQSVANSNGLPSAFSDSSTYYGRYNNLLAQLRSNSYDTMIKTEYIVEFRITDTKDSAIFQRMPVTYGGDSGNTHQWAITLIQDQYGTPATYSDYLYGSDTLTYTFMQPGVYNIAAAQWIQETTTNAFSCSVYEYWVIADTGEVIWARTSNGRLKEDSNGCMNEESGCRKAFFRDITVREPYHVIVYNEMHSVSEGQFGARYIDSGKRYSEEETTFRIE